MKWQSILRHFMKIPNQTISTIVRLCFLTVLEQVQSNRNREFKDCFCAHDRQLVGVKLKKFLVVIDKQKIVTQYSVSLSNALACPDEFVRKRFVQMFGSLCALQEMTYCPRVNQTHFCTA